MVTIETANRKACNPVTSSNIVPSYPTINPASHSPIAISQSPDDNQAFGPGQTDQRHRKLSFRGSSNRGNHGNRQRQARSFHGQNGRPHDRAARSATASGSAMSLASTESWRPPGRRTADSVAEKTGCNPRLVREWLDSQAAGGLLAYDAGRGHLRAQSGSRAGARR